MLGKRVVDRAVVWLRVQEALALFWTLSAPLGLPLRPHDVMHAEGAGAMLQQPGVHTVFMELMSTGDDSQMLSILKLLQADCTDGARVGAAG